ncbi:MAG: hypothetical protein J6K75_04530 [Erysipelotrichaceae bacterium]|nr:hypothetical protein [Erysipelotrichaceae bacterium]
MKKRTLLLGAALAAASFFAIKNNQKKSELLWFTLENITYNEELHMISGECTEGTYLGEMEVYLPNHIDATNLKDGLTVKVQGGPGMTMSLPPQLMNCTKIEIVNANAQD